MPKLPSFENWFPITIIEVVANGEEVLEDVISINIPPLKLCHNILVYVCLWESFAGSKCITTFINLRV
jgi:hypothetical protein